MHIYPATTLLRRLSSKLYLSRLAAKEEPHTNFGKAPAVIQSNALLPRSFLQVFERFPGAAYVRLTPSSDQNQA